MKTRAAVLYAPRTPLVVEELDLAPPGPGEVLIAMGAAGVCHSDHHVIRGQASHALPVVLGHEGAGTVVEAGAGVTKTRLGDHVVLSWIPSCGACHYCGTGKAHLCGHYETPLWDGTMPDGTCRLSRDGKPYRHLSMLACWSEYAVVPEDSCVVIGKDVPFEIAALLGCAVTTGVGAVLNRARVEPGSSVAVVGAGGVGLSVIMGARLAGAATIIAIDSRAGKERMARDLGATDFVLSGDKTKDDVLARTANRGADYVFEAVGNPALQRACLEFTSPGGQLTFVGLAANDATIALPSTGITRTEKIVTGSIFGSADTNRDFAAYADHYLAGRLPIDRLIGHRYPLDAINSAINDMLAGAAGRGVILFDGENDP